MADEGLAGLLLMTEPELRYFSGFHTGFWQSPTRPWFLFVPAAGKPIAIIPEIGASLMRQSWLEDVRTWPAPMPDDDGISLLTDLLSEHAPQGHRVGLLKGPETHLRMPLGDYERLIAGLPGLEFVDATGLVRRLRMVKSDAEIAKIAHICNVLSASFARVPEIAQAGLSLDTLFREFRRDCLAEGADEVPYLVGGADQGGYHDVISPPTQRPLQNGDILMLDTGAVWDGYYCDFNRNWAVGAADLASQRSYDLLYQAVEAGLATARPGVRTCDLYAAMQGVIARGGGATGDVGRFGHGLGMQLTEWPSLAAWDETVLEERMVLTLEPSLSYGDGRLMVVEEDIVVRKTGPELLTQRAPAELLVI